MSAEPNEVPHDNRELSHGADLVERLTFLLGPGLFAALVIGGFFAGLAEWHGMTFGDYLQWVAAGAGLLAVGHGIHRAERMRRSR
ncbi:hypothetical protein [Micromonospora sp. NPDC005173]|uniref:hypothetical protein n=1 Tax=Micromonospora sp. NPDC005173 TaxID=3157165 RepID=UPI0033A8A2B8